MENRTQGHIQDILDAIALIQQFTEQQSVDDFIDGKNVLVQNLAMRQLAIIGEASKKLSKEIYTSHPDIPWHEIARMRNRFIHEYDGVDLRIVWETVTGSLPVLKKALQSRVE